MPRILITGSSSGIGLKTTKLLLDNNFEVIGVSRTTNPEIEKNPLYSHINLDLSKPQLIEKNNKKLLGDITEIDAIICNAGIGKFGHLEEFSLSQMSDIMSVNFISQAYLVKLLLPEFKRRKKGDIIFIGSEAALQGKKKGTVYCASKFAMRGFAQALKDEVAFSNIRVSIIQPGMTKTPFFTEHNFEPDDNFHSSLSPGNIADLVLMILNSSQNILFDEIVLSPLQRKIQKKPQRTI